MKYLLAFIVFSFAVTLRLDSSARRAFPIFPEQFLQHIAQQTTASTHEPVLPGSPHGCTPLMTDKPEKGVLSSQQDACFTVEVNSGEAAQLQLDQPEDLEMQLTGGPAERLVDSFDLGVETLTIDEPGTYRVKIRKVKPSPHRLTLSIVRWKLELQKAAAWEQAETWATISKKSRTVADVDKSLALWVDLGDTSSIARAYLKRGSILNRNDPANARIAFEKALELCRANFDTRCSAEAENNSGLMSRRLGEVDKAGQRLEEAARDWQKLADQPNLARTRSNLGLMLWQSGDVKQAIVSLDEAARILRRNDILGHAKALNNLALCYQSMAEYEKARWYLKGSIAEFVGAKSQRDLIRARINLGRNYMLAGDLPRALSVFERAMAEANRLADLGARADAMRNLAQALWQTGKTAQAHELLTEALKVDRFDGDRRGQSSALHYLGLIAEKSGDVATARSLLREAADIRLEISLRDDATESLFALAELEHHAGRLDAARDCAEQALKLLESVRSDVPGAALRASFYSRKHQLFDLLVELAMATDAGKSQAEGLLAVERGKARSLMDLLAEGSLLNQLPPNLVAQRASIQHRIDFLVMRLSDRESSEPSALTGKAQTAIREEIQHLIIEDEAIEARIRQSISSQKLTQPLKSIEELQSDLLLSGCALLEYHLGARQSYLWFVDAHQIQVFKLPKGATIESEAKPVVEGFGHILERRRSPVKQAAYTKALRKLSVTLLGQLSEVPLTERLILVPDEVLHRLPFAALQLPNAVEPLGLAHDLVQIPSASYLLAGARPRPIRQFRQTILAVTDPVFSADDPRVTGGLGKSHADPGNDLPRLPFNHEIETIELRVPRNRFQILRGFAASRAKLDHVRLEDFGILHFSTHALIDDRMPELSWIALSRVDRAGRPVEGLGLLRPYQLAQFHLSSSIVVLSACDTALGKQVLGEGLMGFSSSLLYAGGSQLVLALTQVDAAASSWFLSDVYRQYLPGNNSMEHSITLARRTMARSRPFSDPYYWASFVVIGRPTDTADTGIASMQEKK